MMMMMMMLLTMGLLALWHTKITLKQWIYCSELIKLSVSRVLCSVDKAQKKKFKPHRNCLKALCWLQFIILEMSITNLYVHNLHGNNSSVITGVVSTVFSLSANYCIKNRFGSVGLWLNWDAAKLGSLTSSALTTFPHLWTRYQQPRKIACYICIFILLFTNFKLYIISV